jgi:hypothetical protein
VQDLAEREQHRRPLRQRRRPPLGERSAGRRDDRVDVGAPVAGSYTGERRSLVPDQRAPSIQWSMVELPEVVVVSFMWIGVLCGVGGRGCGAE